MEAREEGKEQKTSSETESHEWKEKTDFHLCKRLMSEYAIFSYGNLRQRNRYIYYMKELIDLEELLHKASKQVCT